MRCLDRKLRDSECRPNSPWKRTGAGRVFMENLQGLPIARRVIREQEVLPSSDVDGQGVEDIKPCRCRPILGQGRTKIFTVESGTRFFLNQYASLLLHQYDTLLPGMKLYCLTTCSFDCCSNYVTHLP